MIEKPFSVACRRNQEPILTVLREHFADRQHLLEIGSGTGQHAIHFAAALSHLTWQTADRVQYLNGIRQWLQEAKLANLPPPIELDVNDWPGARLSAHKYDAVFSANTLHIMSWSEVEKTFAGLVEVLEQDAKLVIYGPFNYEQQFTSASNAAFDASLKSAAAHMGIRDFEAVDALARAANLELVEDRTMPANNRCIVWRRRISD